MCSWGLHFLYFFFLFSGCFLSRMFHSLMQVRHHVINGYVPTVNSWSNLLCSNGCKILHRFTHHRKTGAFYRMLLTSSDNPHSLLIPGKVCLTLNQFLLSTFALSRAEHVLSSCQSLSTARCAVELSCRLGPGSVPSLAGCPCSLSTPAIHCSLLSARLDGARCKATFTQINC